MQDALFTVVGEGHFDPATDTLKIRQSWTIHDNGVVADSVGRLLGDIRTDDDGVHARSIMMGQTTVTTTTTEAADWLLDRFNERNG